jgi:hypothetical protein
VLVATDCLSEGINLQQAFSAVLHYDLPWNPNRLEQREGRVDRYGQPAGTVKAIRFFSPDSPVDGVVLDVLLNKAREIHRTLGTHVPVPAEGESVTEALLNALFLRGQPSPAASAVQKRLHFGGEEVASFHRRWEYDAEREKLNRTRFAQRALKPEEVRRELEATDAVLGDPAAVREFVLAAAQRIQLPIHPEPRAPHTLTVAVDPATRETLPPPIRDALPAARAAKWPISFASPTPAGAEYLGRNHPFVAALARYLLEEALTKGGEAAATRCGVLRTGAVERLTTLWLLRVRYLVRLPERAPLLSEEVLVAAAAARAGGLDWLSDDEALRLLAVARPDANLPLEEKRQLVAAALDRWPAVESDLRERIERRAAELEKSHKRLRQAVSLRVRELEVVPQLPPDQLGLLVLQPLV